jgi:sporulation-control protein spo0M
MKKEYDFTNAEQGKFHKPLKELDIPVYLDREIIEYFMNVKKHKNRNFSLSEIINTLLRKDIEISKELQE